METIESETRTEERLSSYPSTGLKDTNEKLVDVDGKGYLIELTGNYTYEITTFVKAYTKNGEYLKEVEFKTEYKKKYESHIINPLFGTHDICYINNNFYPIVTKGMRLDEINETVRLIENSFDVEKEPTKDGRGYYSYLTYDETDWVCRMINEYDTNFQIKSYKDKNRVPMFCVAGRHTRSVTQYVDAETFDLEEYKENIKKAKKKYPDWVEEIDRMVLWNKDSIKLIKKLKRRLNK